MAREGGGRGVEHNTEEGAPTRCRDLYFGFRFSLVALRTGLSGHGTHTRTHARTVARTPARRALPLEPVARTRVGFECFCFLLVFCGANVNFCTIVLDFFFLAKKAFSVRFGSGAHTSLCVQSLRFAHVMFLRGLAEGFPANPCCPRASRARSFSPLYNPIGGTWTYR